MPILWISIFLICILGCSSSQNHRALSSVPSPYCGCLIFIDDVNTEEDLEYALTFAPDFLLRSWYRWGEPPGSKNYLARNAVIEAARKKKVGIGGGASLSFVNERDLASPEFDRSWLSLNLDGTPIERNGRKFSSLSAPGFRKYLVSKLLQQAKMGILELHLGESNGEIHFDDWTLGLKGDQGFLQWIKENNSTQPLKWWTHSFGSLGEKIYKNRTVQRDDFIALETNHRENFLQEFGRPGSWQGKNSAGESAFLAQIYRQNLESFLKELKFELHRNGLKHVVIDVWGFADWMSKMSIQPDAYISTPPDERWNLNWSLDLSFDLNKNRERIKKIMEADIASVSPVPVIYMIDHSKPFDDFKKLPDARQAEITKYFSNIMQELSANFVFRAYSRERSQLGPKTKKVIITECQKRRPNFCPSKL